MKAFASLLMVCLAAGVVAAPADSYEDPPFEPLVVDAEGAPAEGLFTLNFWRLLNPVERTNGIGRVCKLWKDATSCQVLPDGCESMMETTLLKDGRYLVDWVFKVSDGELPPLPRVGISFPLKSTFSTVHWSGRGPWENYPSRRNGSKFGSYAADMSLIQGRPDFGYRSGCRWVEISEPGGGRGMRITAVNAPFGFSIRPRSDLRELYTMNIDAYLSSEMSPDKVSAKRPETYRLTVIIEEI